MLLTNMASMLATVQFLNVLELQISWEDDLDCVGSSSWQFWQKCYVKQRRPELEKGALLHGM